MRIASTLVTFGCSLLLAVGSGALSTADAQPRPKRAVKKAPPPKPSVCTTCLGAPSASPVVVKRAQGGRKPGPQFAPFQPR